MATAPAPTGGGIDVSDQRGAATASRQLSPARWSLSADLRGLAAGCWRVSDQSPCSLGLPSAQFWLLLLFIYSTEQRLDIVCFAVLSDHW